MRKIKYIIIILLSIPFVTTAMDKQLLLQAKQKSQVKATQGEYVTGRSAERTQRLLAAPVYDGTKNATNSGRELSQAPVTIRKKTPSTNNSAKTLYDLSIFSHREKRNARLDSDTSIAQKIGFDMSIKCGDVNKTIKFLNANNRLKTSYPLAIKLYAVMTNQTDELEIHPSETRIIPVHKICHMAKSLAVFGQNEQFLEKYARIAHEDPEMRKIINGDQ